MALNITLLPSGVVFPVNVNDKILDSALAANVNLPYSCKDGTCGSCKSLLVNGEVDHPVDCEGISIDERNNGFVLTCVARVKSNVSLESEFLVELDGIKEVFSPCKVVNVLFTSDEIAILILRLPPKNIFKYLSGQYIDLIFNGVKRSYSIANAKLDNNLIELHVRKVEGGQFSRIIFNDLKENTLMRLSGPYGSFFVRASDAPIIFLAGGTGMAPVKAMVEQLVNEGSERLIFIYWGVTKIEHLYTQLPEQWAVEYENISYEPVLFNDDISWSGQKGYVHEAVLESFESLESFHVYACGSPEMISVARKEFIKKGLSDKLFYSDAFVAHKPDIK